MDGNVLNLHEREAKIFQIYHCLHNKASQIKMCAHARACVQQLWQQALSTMNGSPPLSSSEWRTATGGKARHLRSLSLFLSLRLPVAPSLCLVSRLLTEEPQAAVHSVWLPSSFNERWGEGRFLSAAANRVRLSVCPTVWPSVCLLGSHLQPSNLFSICFFFLTLVLSFSQCHQITGS